MMWIVVVFVVGLVAVGYWVYRLPTDGKASSKKKKRQETKQDEKPEVNTKNWEEIALRWERNNQKLNQTIAVLQEEAKKQQEAIAALNEQSKNQQELITSEQNWRQKESEQLKRSKGVEKELKDQISLTEKDLEREHAARISLEGQLQDLRIKHDALSEEKRKIQVEASSLEATVKDLSAKFRDLRRINAELSRKEHDVKWVAKTQYDALKSELEKLKKGSSN